MFICGKHEVCTYYICVHRKLHELDSFEVQCNSHVEFHSCIKGSKCVDPFIDLVEKTIKKELRNE